MGPPSIAVFPSELGWMTVAWSERCLYALSFGHSTEKAARRFLKENAARRTAGGAVQVASRSRQPKLASRSSSPRSPRARNADGKQLDGFLAELTARLQSYARGECTDGFRDWEVDFSGMTAFQRAVVRYCRDIPAGQTATYGELATRAGRPGAARAVGQVMAANRVPLVVPCHRVVAANGRLGGYSGPQGLAMKRRLLIAEGVNLDSLGKLPKPARPITMRTS